VITRYPAAPAGAGGPLYVQKLARLGAGTLHNGPPRRPGVASGIGIAHAPWSGPLKAIPDSRAHIVRLSGGSGRRAEGCRCSSFTGGRAFRTTIWRAFPGWGPTSARSSLTTRSAAGAAITPTTGTCRIHLFGHSWGGWLALEYAPRSAERGCQPRPRERLCQPAGVRRRDAEAEGLAARRGAGGDRPPRGGGDHR
jgi:pimeloyl-ACP methyl ester carboxylesterase